MRRLSLLSLVLIAAVLITLTAADEGRPADDALTKLLGPWKVRNEDRVLLVTPERMISHQNGELVIAGIVRYEKSTMWLRSYGEVVTMQVVVREGMLLVEFDGKTTECEPLDEIPPEVDLKPLSLGEPDRLSDERRHRIREELAERAEKDQEARREPSRRDEIPAIDAVNTSYLKALVQDVGWIDVGRFGEDAAHHAFLLVQHSMDLPLMMAVLPRIEADVASGSGLGVELALLHDRVQLLLGERQRYGTNWVETDDGRRLLPLEDPERVDEFRKELGLPPLEDYPILPDGE
jgi:hypothetical protein